MGMSRQTLTTDWKLAFFAGLLSDDAESPEQLEIAAAMFEENPETKGIANLLRDRADDIRLAAACYERASLPQQ
jgi:hypothetical protein